MAQREVNCNLACMKCRFGLHEACEDPEYCECANWKNVPMGWRQWLRERIDAILGTSPGSPSGN